jgi:hypothetical protein
MTPLAKVDAAVRSGRSRYGLAFIGIALGVLAVVVAYQQRGAVARREVESYSTFPVLMLMVAGVVSLFGIVRLALTNPRRPKVAATCLLVMVLCAVTTRALWDTSVPHDRFSHSRRQRQPLWRTCPRQALGEFGNSRSLPMMLQGERGGCGRFGGAVVR